VAGFGGAVCVSAVLAAALFDDKLRVVALLPLAWACAEAGTHATKIKKAVKVLALDIVVLHQL